MKNVCILCAILLSLTAPGVQSWGEPSVVNYGDIMTNGMVWLDEPGEEWDLTKGDLTVSYVLDMSAYVPPVGASLWSRVGVGGGASGWLRAGAPYAASSISNTLYAHDKLHLQTPTKAGEWNYDARGPEWPVVAPIGRPQYSYGIWFDRDGITAQQRLTQWGLIDGKTYNTRGIYSVVVVYHAVNESLGTMFAVVNGIQTGFYGFLRNAPPDYSPVGMCISGDLTNLQLFAEVKGAGVKILGLTASGYPRNTVIEVAIDVKPGSDTNPVNLKANGVIPIAVFSSDEVSAADLDPTTISFAGAGVAVKGKKSSYMAHQEDVDLDGLPDLVIQVGVQDLVLDEITDSIGILTGTTYGGQSVVGSDVLTIIQDNQPEFRSR